MGFIKSPTIYYLMLCFFALLFFCFVDVGSVFAVAPPNVNSISPSSGSSAGGTDVTISGTGFAAGTVTIGGTSVTNLIIVSTTQMTATTPAGTVGAQDVVFTRTSDGKSDTLAGGFTYTAPADTTAPSAVSDLATSGATINSIDLDWTAPGDDAGTGTATTYDVRYSTAIINDENWSSATQATGEPNPSIAGSSESMTVSGLSPSTTYYFAIKTSDEVPNTSDISNVPSGTTNEESTIVISGDSGGGGVAATKVVFEGQAYPGSKIIVQFKDNISENYRNVPLSTYNMSSSGEFSISYTALLTGKYFFILKARDRANKTTGIKSYNVDFTFEKSLIDKEIFFPPTLNFGNGIYSSSEDVEICGYSEANNKINLNIDDIIKRETNSDKEGFYKFLIDSQELGAGNYYAKVNQTDESGKESGFSFPRAFKITDLSFPKADLNGDNAINIVDWSMFLFRWGSEEEHLRREIDLDDSGEINIFDFSLFLKAISI